MEAETYRLFLDDENARAARRAYVCEAAKKLDDVGAALWGFGLTEAKSRRGIAIVIQMAGRLGSGAVTLLSSENWYAAACTLRQLVEIEYLVWLFSAEPGDASTWLGATSSDMRRKFAPSMMRKLLGSVFRDDEYWVHCEIGGHPNPKAQYLLPERVFPEHEHALGQGEPLWVDLGRHLRRLWGLVATLADRHEVGVVRSLREAIDRVEAAAAAWLAADPCAVRPVERADRPELAP